jgi:hypothetical protein
VLGSGECTLGMSEPLADARLRPMQTIGYGAAALKRRIIRACSTCARTLTVATAERALGLPALHTSFDSARTAAYSAIVESARAGEDWSLLLSFDESFSPPIETRPARLRGTLRPVLIDRGRRGRIKLELRWLRPGRVGPDSSACITLGALADAARALGWRRRSVQILFTSHIGNIFRSKFRKGSLQATTDATDDKACIRDLSIEGEADSEEPPATEAELARIRSGS